DLDFDRREACLALGLDVGLEEAPELAAVAVGGCVAVRLGRGVGFLVGGEEDLVEREVTLLHPLALELLLDLLAERIHADLVDEDLDPGPGRVTAPPSW